MRSLWTDPEEACYPSLEGHIEADIAIVGGGLSGIGAAYALRHSGASVVLLEERTLASGASGRNAGFVLAGPATAFRDAVRSLGADVAADIWTFTLENNRDIGRIVEEETLDCGYLRRGSMSVAASQAEWELMRADLECLQEAAIEAATVDRRDLPRPFDRLYFGGIYHPGNGEIDPGRFVRGVGRVVAGRIRIFERTAVRAVQRRGVWELRTPAGAVEARQVLLATNAYTSSLLPRVLISPRRGQVLSTLPLDRVVVPFPMYANYGFQYWRQDDEGRLVVGGWRDLDIPAEVGTDERLHDQIQDALHGFCRSILGERFSVQHRWAGIMGFTPDMLPLCGPVPDQTGLFMAAGYSGHGVAMAFTCGGHVASRMVGGSCYVPAAFDPGRPALTATSTPVDVPGSRSLHS